MVEQKSYRPIYFAYANGFNPLSIDQYKKADLHLHTTWSDGLVIPEKMVDIALATGLDAIAITDHDKIQGSDAAMNYAARNNLPLEVIRGIEVSSKDGHVLALNTESTVNRGMSLVDTIRKIHRQNGLAIVAHPHVSARNSVSLRAIENIINSNDPELYLDGIEIFNASEERMCRLDKPGIVFRSDFSEVMKFVKKNLHNPKLGALLGGSDGHTQRIGQALSLYSHASVLTAIVHKEISVMVANTSFREDLIDATVMAYAIILSHLNGSM